MACADAAKGKRQTANGKRQAASGKRQTANGKRQTASGKRQAAKSAALFRVTCAGGSRNSVPGPKPAVGLLGLVHCGARGQWCAIELSTRAQVQDEIRDRGVRVRRCSGEQGATLTDAIKGLSIPRVQPCTLVNRSDNAPAPAPWRFQGWVLAEGGSFSQQGHSECQRHARICASRLTVSASKGQMVSRSSATDSVAVRRSFFRLVASEQMRLVLEYSALPQKIKAVAPDTSIHQPFSVCSSTCSC